MRDAAPRFLWILVDEARVPRGDDWLGAGERERLAAMKHPERRRDFRRGRFAARAALAAALGGPPTAFEVIAAPDGAPEPWRDGARVPAALSLSHRAGRALAVVYVPAPGAYEAPGAPVTPVGAILLGADLELVEPRSPAFVSDWFNPAEQDLCARAPTPAARDEMAVRIWSAKESALKALRTGLRLDTRAVEVTLPATSAESDGTDGTDGSDRASEHPAAITGGWHPLTVTPVDPTLGPALPGWWRREGDWMITLVTSGVPHPPKRLVPAP